MGTRASAAGSMSNTVVENSALLPSIDGLEHEATYWSGKIAWDDNDDKNHLSQEQRMAHSRKATEAIHELYRAGVPFFSKTAIQNVVAQIDRTNALVGRVGRTPEMEKENFVVAGLDGNLVKFRMETGEAHDVQGGGRQLVHMVPMLSYQCYQHLTDEHHALLWGHKLAYCPLRITYRIYLRETNSKVAIPLDDLQKRKRTEGWPPTEESLRKEFDACLANWDEANDLSQRLEFALQEVELPTVTKIVAFACATISNAERDVARCQHVLLLALKRILEARRRQQRSLGEPTSTKFDATPPIQCFAQDPAYIDVDRIVLAEHGVTVLDDPRGFLQVDDQSAVLSFAPNICVRQIVADLARPAVLIWNTVRNEDDSLNWWRATPTFGEGSDKGKTLHELEGSLTDPESPRLRDMIRNEYTEVMKVGNDILGSDVSVYVRKRR